MQKLFRAPKPQKVEKRPKKAASEKRRANALPASKPLEACVSLLLAPSVGCK